MKDLAKSKDLCMKKVDFSVFVESELAGLGLAGDLIVEGWGCRYALQENL